MLATALYIVLVLAIFAALGAPTVARRRVGSASIVDCVVAGVLTLTLLEDRRRSRLAGREPDRVHDDPAGRGRA